MKGSRGRAWPVVTTDGTGIASHAGTASLRELAERSGLRAEYSAAADGIRRRGGGHDPGQALVDVAVMLADGGEAIADIAALADQPDLHGPVASPTTAWRVLAGIDERRLAGMRAARAVARERAWLARAEQCGRMLPPAHAAGRDLDYVVLDIDAILIEVHSEKGASVTTLQGRVRDAPDPVFPGQHQRGSRRDPAHRASTVEVDRLHGQGADRAAARGRRRRRTGRAARADGRRRCFGADAVCRSCDLRPRSSRRSDRHRVRASRRGKRLPNRKHQPSHDYTAGHRPRTAPSSNCRADAQPVPGELRTYRDQRLRPRPAPRSRSPGSHSCQKYRL